MHGHIYAKQVLLPVTAHDFIRALNLYKPPIDPSVSDGSQSLTHDDQVFFKMTPSVSRDCSLQDPLDFLVSVEKSSLILLSLLLYVT